MATVLLTGATGFLGYHVAKKLNEAGVRPRVLELRESRPEVLAGSTWSDVPGISEDPAAIRAACAGVDTLLHLAFKVGVGSGTKLHEDMQRINIAGTRQLLETAAASGVKRAVVAGSALGVGVNRNPVPLDESADWSEHGFNLPYANLRRQAELEARARSSSSFGVMTVCPAFTFGPDDPVGAPANKLVQAVISGKLRFTLPVGFGCLDVRDFASGVVLAAERGRPGQRYLLSGENVTTNQFFEEAASIAGVRAPRFTPPTMLVRVLVARSKWSLGIRRKVGSAHARRAAGCRALRLVRHLESASRTGLVFQTIERDARGHDPRAAHPASSHADTNAHEHRAGAQ